MGDFSGTTPVVLGGSVPDGTDWATILAQLTAENTAWTDYSASMTWASGTGGTNPAKGNAVIEARYRRVGKTVDVRVSITMGSTTTFGTGFWVFGLPIAGLDAANTCSAALLDSSANTRYAASGVGGGTVFLLSGTTLVGGAGSTPFAWAVGDILQFSLTYEVA